jgi:hypothetical protein
VIWLGLAVLRDRPLRGSLARRLTARRAISAVGWRIVVSSGQIEVDRG